MPCGQIPGGEVPRREGACREVPKLKPEDLDYFGRKGWPSPEPEYYQTAGTKTEESGRVAFKVNPGKTQQELEGIQFGLNQLKNSAENVSDCPNTRKEEGIDVQPKIQ